MHELFGEVISIYTRAQAIEDGVLVNVSNQARNNGFKIGTCVTASVWSDISDRRSEEEAIARLNDVLWMASVACRRSGSSNQTTFQVKLGNRVRVYKLVVGPGDRGEAVVTIMQTNED